MPNSIAMPEGPDYGPADLVQSIIKHKEPTMPDYDAMSDREIDAAVAVKVMGWPTVDDETPYRHVKQNHAGLVTSNGRVGKFGVGLIPHDFSPSTDANAARQVGERMKTLDLQSQWVSEVMRRVFDASQPGGDQSYRMIQCDSRTRCIAALIVMDQQEADK